MIEKGVRLLRIVVGMSGGVDSSVTALLLKQQGHEVIGVFMNNWEEQDEGGACTAVADWADVRHVAEAIGIPYYSVNFAKQYKEKVFAHFLSEYRLGRTPNPDVWCNREIKFGVLLDFARKLGAEKLATGHFAGVALRDGAYHLLRAADENKDQTYFLYMLTQAQLGYALFPVTDLTKAEIREIARKNGLPVSEKKDSTGVCFIGERNFKQFLQTYLPAQPGDMVDESGRVLGRHDGLMYYTLGQRRGLGIGGGGTGERWFVIRKDLANNRLVVAQGEDASLYQQGALLCEGTWIAGAPPVEDAWFDCMVRLRHRQKLQKARARASGEAIELQFEARQRAVTPGQAAVIYRGDEALGGGTVI
ncbi:MAG: tRNA 2-thiouridine(34) synthase MnmA [Clostridia bacterium]